MLVKDVLKGNYLVSACSFGGPNNTNFCNKVCMFFVVNRDLWLSCCTLKLDQRFLCAFFMIISHPNFSFQLDSLESHGGSGHPIVITSPACGPVQSFDVIVNCLKEISGTNPLRGRWISF